MIPGAPWLSVVMPIHDGEHFLAAALESIRRERVDGIEVIAIDDGSSDGSRQILERFGTELPLRVLDHGGRSWVTGSNLGLREARGTFACFLHQDDAWLPGRLEAVRRALADAPQSVLVLHDARFIDDRGRRLGTWRCPLPAGEVPSSLAVERLLVQNFVAIPCPVFRRETAVAAGGLDPDLWFTADWDLWLRLAAAGPVRFVPRVLAEYRVHPAAQTLSRSATCAEFTRQLETVLVRHLGKWSVERRRRRAVVQAARFSVLLNASLAGASRGEPLHAFRLGGRFLALGPAGWRRYLRDSRIVERLVPRLKLRWRARRSQG